MQEDLNKKISQLASLVVMQNEHTANLLGQLKVVSCALSALVRTHPDPEAFAQAFRRSWLQSETPLGDAAADHAALEGIEQVLVALEGNCPVPLNIRPPGKAAPSEC